jgi:predicted ribosome quality control (RQC) complex YloA/Tae2 family protein
MALDAILLSGIVSELRPKIVGARIDKVQQPERDKIVFSLRGGESLRLLVDVGAGSGRIQQTKMSFENPAEPPMFCMLLRKYLTGGRIETIEQPDWERLVLVNITSRNELGDNVDLRLAVELMGRSSNLILIGSDGRIIDCLRRMDYGGDAERRLLPGMIYRLPPKQRKPLVFSLSQAEIEQTLSASDAGKSADKRIMDSFSGLSPLVCREIACRSGDNPALLPEAIAAFIESVRAGELTPILFTEDGKPKEFSFMQLRQYSGVYQSQTLDSFSELLDAYYSKRDILERRRRRSKELSHHVKTAHDRIARKLAAQKQELEKCSERDEIRRNAELLTANLYRVRKGDASVTVEDYYEPECPQRTIKLNPLKTPQANAAAMFKEYNKLKTAEQYLTSLISEGERQLEYLSSVLDETNRAETEDDLAEIKAELVGTGYIKKQRGAKERKHKKQGPMRFMSSDGFEILVGRSNSQNDELTTKTARRTDIWLHTKTVHGSHVIISCDGLTPPERTIEEAARLAVFYSQARDGGKTLVDYTMVRNVRKPSGSLPGKVIYSDYSTISVSADEALAERLRTK